MRLVDVKKTVLKLGSLRVPIKETTRPELVPARYGVHEVKVPDEALSHLKWLLQKEILGQDVFLIGVPGALRSDIVLQYLELCNREYEYLAITRDTTESDIKQRREIRSGTAFYTDLVSTTAVFTVQCAVRAALHGRILVIDGVEKAERNVLPILNNLLENREMQLDDGRFLMRPDKYDKLIGNYTINELREMGIERVSERFHVIALGLPVPRFHGNSLDPPLRSRFQCRNIAEPSFEAVRQLCTTLAPNVNSNSINDLLSLLYAINSQPDLGLSLVPLEKAERIMRIWNINPSYSPESMFNLMYPYKSMFKEHHIKVTEEFIEKFISEVGTLPTFIIVLLINNSIVSRCPLSIQRSKSSEPAASITRVSPSDKGTSTTVEVSFDQSRTKRTFSTEVSGKPSSEDRSFVSTPSQEALLADLAVAHSQGDFALLGAKGTGKTKLIAELAGRLGFNTDTMILYQDMNARELLQRRRMLDNGDTLWEDSQLVAAAKRGDVCVLDGAERLPKGQLCQVHWSALESLASLCYHRTLFLPDGSRLVGSDEFDNIQKKTGNDEEHLNSRYGRPCHIRLLFDEIYPCFRGVFRIPKSFRLVLIGSSSLTENKWLNETVISLMPFFTMQKLSIDDQCKILQGLVPAEASETTRKLIEFVDKLQSSGDASLRGVAESLSIRKLIHIAKRDCLHPGELRDLIEKAALARFLPSVTRLAFHTELDKAGFVKNPSSTDELSDDLKYLLDKNAVEDKKETMIPDVLFYENDQHMSVIRDMARDMRLGAHLLLIGNQGVGKNKITDRFLHLIQRPRQYMQLHRDTTVESITMQTTVENGILRYEDSALVRAARAGHVLVIDEADKAPLHVIAILKSLLDSGTLLLGDGRRIQPASAPPCDRSIPLHPDFRIIMLANRPGFPFLGSPYSTYSSQLRRTVSCFLGNDLFGLLGDLFSVHTVDNPDRDSELEMLKKYAPGMKLYIILCLVERGTLLLTLRDVEDGTLLKLMAAFTELREMADEGLLQYPYSTRELVNIVKHVNQFPNDSLSTVIRNVFDFDAFTSDAIATIQTVFQKHGIPFGVKRPREHVFVSHRFPIEPSSSIGEWGAVDNVVPIDVKTSVASINAKAQPLKAKSLKLIKEYVRTQQFTEQECAWQIPMLDVNICSDGLVLGNSLIVATVNPTRIYVVKDLYLTDEVFEIDISSMLSHHNLLKYEPRIRLAQYGEGSFLVHEEVSGSILLVDLNRNTIQRIDLGESALSNFANRFLKSERRLVQGGCPLLYTREGNQISRFEPGGTITQMTLGGEISKVFPVGSDKILVKMKSATDVIGSVKPTPSNVVDGRRPYYLSDDVVKKFIDPYRNLIALREGVVVRAQPKWKVPKDAAGEGRVNVHEIGGFLEAVNADNGFVQYIPVPEPRYHSYHGPWCATISQTPFIIVPYNDERMLTIDTCGGVRSYELSPNTLGRAFFEWNRLVGGEDDHNLRENTPHHGGNQWMGGTGGYSTAGLGGVGGPFRLDAGHDVHQMPDSVKKQVPDYVLKKAREVAKAEYQKRLKEIAMSEYDADAYMTFWNKIEKHSNHLRSIIEQLEAKKKERQWARHQTSGDLDDGKLIEGITGERNIYRRRLDKRPEPGAPQLKPKRMQLCFDVSGSMYRFNGYDKRLQKSLEVALMVMTSFEGKQEKVAVSTCTNCLVSFCTEV
ncbi:unnamed protein product [Haemonchus placei]|uniref:VWFA domain-containing protein n=1 Tax=Haemonchus placei TaxID=6290 RepID=A0A0N4WFX3_HAEPC|nr:unnamed protein product [Haemonchus placei]